MIFWGNYLKRGGGERESITVMRVATMGVRTRGGRLFRGSGLGNEGRMSRLKSMKHNKPVAPSTPVVKPSSQDTDHGQGIMGRWRW